MRFSSAGKEKSIATGDRKKNRSREFEIREINNRPENVGNGVRAAGGGAGGVITLKRGREKRGCFHTRAISQIDRERKKRKLQLGGGGGKEGKRSHHRQPHLRRIRIDIMEIGSSLFYLFLFFRSTTDPCFPGKYSAYFFNFLWWSKYVSKRWKNRIRKGEENHFPRKEKVRDERREKERRERERKTITIIKEALIAFLPPPPCLIEFTLLPHATVSRSYLSARKTRGK